VTRDLLWAVARGEVPASAVTQIGVQQLMSLCPTCRQELLAFQKERTASAAAEYDRVFRLLPALPGEKVPQLDQEDHMAERDLADLLALPRAERAPKVQREYPCTMVSTSGAGARSKRSSVRMFSFSGPAIRPSSGLSR